MRAAGFPVYVVDLSLGLVHMGLGSGRPIASALLSFGDSFDGSHASRRTAAWHGVPLQVENHTSYHREERASHCDACLPACTHGPQVCRCSAGAPCISGALLGSQRLSPCISGALPGMLSPTASSQTASSRCSLVLHCPAVARMAQQPDTSPGQALQRLVPPKGERPS
jgi:hypothetical protein